MSDFLSRRYVKNVMRTATTLNIFAVRNEMSDRSPFLAVKPPSVTPREDVHLLDPAKERLLFESLLRLDLRHVRNQIVPELDHGFRSGMFGKLMRSNLLKDDQAVRIRGSITKGIPGQGRQTVKIPLTRRAFACMLDQDRMAEEACTEILYFRPSDPRCPATSGVFYRGYQQALAVLGWGRHRVHDMRHTSTNRYKSAGITDAMKKVQEESMEAIQHESEEASETYSHWDANLATLRPVVAALERWLRRHGAAYMTDEELATIVPLEQLGPAR